MKKLYILTAVAALAFAAPTMASAQNIGVNVGGDRGHSEHMISGRGEMRHDGGRPGVRIAVREDRGYHRGWRHARAERVVIVKKVRHHRRHF